MNNLLVARGDGNLRAEDRLQLEVVAPQLDVATDGPKRRYLEREATYVVSLSNPGTAPARQVELVAYLPRGLRFVRANNAGLYEPATQSVHWLLEELPANDTDKVELVTLPVEPGPQKIRIQGKAERGLAVQREQPVVVEGIAAVLFEVRALNNPVEVGGETVYEIRVGNQGSKAATNVRITALIPTGMRPLVPKGPRVTPWRAIAWSSRVLAGSRPRPTRSIACACKGFSPAIFASACSSRPTRCRSRSPRKRARKSTGTSRPESRQAAGWTGGSSDERMGAASGPRHAVQPVRPGHVARRYLALKPKAP